MTKSPNIEWNFSPTKQLCSAANWLRDGFIHNRSKQYDDKATRSCDKLDNTTRFLNFLPVLHELSESLINLGDLTSQRNENELTLQLMIRIGS